MTTLNNAVYRNSTYSVEERVKDLLARMTLDEKIAQLGAVWVFEVMQGRDFSAEKAQKAIPHGLGQLTRVAGAGFLPPVANAELTNTIQAFLVNQTRLGIPAMVHEECLSGFIARRATIFPQMIGAASTWQPELVEAMTSVIRSQMRRVGAHQGLSPVLDVCRDPRWGRVEETFGEDPYLIASMGAAYVRGLQGSDLKEGVVATGKHFVGYGTTEGGLNWSPAHIAPRELRDVYLLPFEAVVKEAKVASMMNAYHELDGVPCGASKELLTEILRHQWGFDGIVVSDYMAVDMLQQYHQVAANKGESARLALEAGIDIELPAIDCYGPPLHEAVIKQGRVSMALIDETVSRVLDMKFRLGLFEQPYADTGKVLEVYDQPAQRDLSRQMAQQAIVLLKNKDNLLPLKKDIASIAVIGPNADDRRNMLGDYTFPAHVEITQVMASVGLTKESPPEIGSLDDVYARMVTVLAGLKAAVSPHTQVYYAKGCEVLGDSTAGFAEAVAAAQKADVAVVVVGDKCGLTPDCSCGEFRDRADLGLPGVQQQLVQAIYDTGTPVVLVLVNGRPFALPWAVEHIPAMVEAWLPGEEGGTAIASVLFGDTNPGGKLPISFPRSVGQVPVFYGHKPSGARSFYYGDYVDLSTKPLFLFGYGLSYTRFEFANLQVTPGQVAPSGEVKVSVEVKNVGQRPGDEVVQLYTHDVVASVAQPVKALKGFCRVSLEPGQTKTITFTLAASQLAFHNQELKLVVEPGAIEVMVGNSSENLPLTGKFEITGHTTETSRAFFSRVEVK